MRHHPTALALSLLVASCHEGPIERHLALAPEDGWPRAQSTVVDDALRVEVTKMERLRPEVALTAWARGHHGPAVRLGVVAPGGVTTFSARAAGVAWADVHELLLTEEAASATPAEPATTVPFRGLPGGPLPFAGVASMATATVAAHVEDGTLTVEAANLPPPGGRTYYGAWLVGPSATTAEARAGATFLGRLAINGYLEVTGLAAPALRREVVVAIEFEAGVPEAALESVVLRGAIPVTAEPPGGASGAPAPASSGEGHGGHVH